MKSGTEVSYGLTSYRLTGVANSASLAYRVSQDQRAYHIKKAREEMISALSGTAAGTQYEEAREHLLDQIEQAISDSIDADWTPAHAAQTVLSSLLDHCLPIPTGSTEEVA